MTLHLAPGAWRVLAVLATAFAAVHAGEAGGWLPGWFRWYLDDLLFLPLVLTLALVVQRRAGAGSRWVMPVTHGLGAVVFAGLVFEGLLPGLFGRGVADPADVVAYLAGWAFFQTVLNRPGCDGGGSCRSSGDHTPPEPALQET